MTFGRTNPGHILEGNRIITRNIKVLNTHVYKVEDLLTRQYLLSQIKQLDDILTSASHSKTLLYKWKYKSSPHLVTAQETAVMQKIIKEFTDSIQLNEAKDKTLQIQSHLKLGKIGLQLFLDCHRGNITSLSTTLSCMLMDQYNKAPTEATLKGIEIGIGKVKEFLNKNKIIIESKEDVDSIAGRLLSYDETDLKTVKQILETTNYNIYSDDIVRFVRGRKTFDELEVTKGWKFPAGILDTSDAYLRSLEIPEKKLVQINEETLVLVYDGTLREANKILPSIQYATNNKKSLLLMINGDCVGDALASITIYNNKNRRNNNNSRTVIVKYDQRDNNNIPLQENHDLIKFLNLPQGYSSIYSPAYSQYVPSKVCADEYFGSIDSIKATTAEAFLYNEIEWEKQNNIKFIQKTVTVYIGAQNELEIDQRRSRLDNLINNVLCHGFADGFIPGYGIALVKAIPSVNKVLQEVEDFNMKIGIEAVLACLSVPTFQYLQNVYGINKFQINKNITETIAIQDFTKAYLTNSKETQDLVSSGVLKPYNKISQCLDDTLAFIKLLTSCNTIVSKVFQKPKKDS